MNIRGPVHRTIGCYLQTVGLHKLSVAHFRRAMDVSPYDMPLVTALAEIAGGARDCLARATDCLKPFKNDKDDPLVLYVSALLHRQQGEACVSRSCLASALEHTQLKGHLPMELECRLHLASGEMYLEEGNYGTALEMFEQAYDVSQICQDMTMTSNAIQGLKRVYKHRTDASMEQQLEREEGVLYERTQASLRAALERDVHRSILRWDLTSSK